MEDDRVIPFPRLVRDPGPAPLIPGEIVTLFRLAEQEPWVALDPTTKKPNAVETSVGPYFRLRIELDGPRRGKVLVYLMAVEQQRALVAVHPALEVAAWGSTDEIETSIRRALIFCREIAQAILQSTRIVAEK